MKPAHEDRAYQQEIEDAIFNHWFEHATNCIAASPGGTGKSFVMAKIVKRLVVDYPGTRVMVLAQDGKLLTQNSNELLRYWPQAHIGIYSSGLKRRDTEQPIIFAGIQSIHKRAKAFGERHIFLIDECDLLSPTEETMYQRFYNEMKEVNPNLLMAGLTATPYRLKEGCLTNLDIWDAVVIDLTKTERFNWFIDNKFLKPLITKKPGMEIDITDVAMRGGDFDEKQLQEASDTDEINKAIVDECIKFASDRKCWLMFSSGVKHGYNLEKAFNARGIPAVMLDGKSDPEYRTKKEAEWKSGKIRLLINCGLYARGYDHPPIDAIMWARATQSTAFWVQGCLRGTRTTPAATECLVLDFCGNIRRLGAINDPMIPKPRRKGDGNTGDAPIKECPECYSYVPIQCKSCPDCGYVFPPPKTINKTASTDEIMARGNGDPVIEDFRVLGIKYSEKMTKAGPVFQVRYNTGITSFNKNHFVDGKGKWFFQKWWLHHGGQKPIPENVASCLDRTSELMIPAVIRVDVAKKWPEVVGVQFDDDEDADPF